MSNNLPKIPRRVVTGHRNGVDTIIEDAVTARVIKNDAGFIVSDVWATDSRPVKEKNSAKIFEEFFPKLNKNGSLFRYVVIPPDSQTEKFFSRQAQSPHHLMHKTNTVDYIVILSGQLYLVMEDTETLLNPGDIVIQCGTNHAWSNRTDDVCIQLAILIDAEYLDDKR